MKQLAVKNRCSRRIWRTAAAVLIAVAVIYLLLIAVSIIAFDKFRVDDPGTAAGDRLCGGHAGKEEIAKGAVSL